MTIKTPQDVAYEGRSLLSGKICGVSILRAGETMERALCDVLKDVRLGKILIQTNFETNEQEVGFLRFRSFLSVLFHPVSSCTTVASRRTSASTASS